MEGLSAVPKMPMKKSQNAKPKEALEGPPVLVLHCINKAMVTLGYQRNSSKVKDAVRTE